MSDEIVQTMIIYDDRFVKYHSDFYDKRVVHKPFLKNYVDAVIGQYDEETVIHVIIYDCKDENGQSYITEAKDSLNKENVVVHIINPRSYYVLPECPKVYYYIEISKELNKRRDKIKELIENDPNKDNILVVVCEDYRAISLNYSRPKKETAPN